VFGCHRLATFLDQLVRNLGSKLGAQEKEQVLQFVQAHFDDDRAKSIAKLIDQPPLRLEHIPGFPSFIGEPAAEQTAGSPITKPVTTTAGMSLDASITLDESFTQFLALLSELSPEVLAHELCAIMCDLMFQLGQHLDELVELKWARSNSAEQAPTLQRLAQYFAKVSALTIASILISDTPKQQATIYRLWIRVLQICFDVYKDLNTTAAILAGLTDISVTRLRKFKQVHERRLPAASQTEICSRGADDNDDDDDDDLCSLCRTSTSRNLRSLTSSLRPRITSSHIARCNRPPTFHTLVRATLYRVESRAITHVRLIVPHSCALEGPDVPVRGQQKVPLRLGR